MTNVIYSEHEIESTRTRIVLSAGVKAADKPLF